MDKLAAEEENGIEYFSSFSPPFFLQWKGMRIIDKQKKVKSPTRCKIFKSAPILQDVLCVWVGGGVKGMQKRNGVVVPLLRQRAQMVSWPYSALGWGSASRRLQRSSVPSHGVHFCSPLKKTAEREEGVLRTRRAQTS